MNSVLTDSSGFYEFSSICPGEYAGLCRHIHVRASAEGYGDLFTQLIVPARPGDRMTPETDPVARRLPEVHLLEFKQRDRVLEATFAFHLGAD